MAQASLLYADVKDLAGLDGVVLKQVEEFFVNYQRVRNIKVNILGRHGPDRAHEVLRRSRRKKGFRNTRASSDGFKRPLGIPTCRPPHENTARRNPGHHDGARRVR